MLKINSIMTTWNPEKTSPPRVTIPKNDDLSLPSLVAVGGTAVSHWLSTNQSNPSYSKLQWRIVKACATHPLARQPLTQPIRAR